MSYLSDHFDDRLSKEARSMHSWSGSAHLDGRLVLEDERLGDHRRLPRTQAPLYSPFSESNDDHCGRERSGHVLHHGWSYGWLSDASFWISPERLSTSYPDYHRLKSEVDQSHTGLFTPGPSVHALSGSSTSEALRRTHLDKAQTGDPKSCGWKRHASQRFNRSFSRHPILWPRVSTTSYNRERHPFHQFQHGASHSWGNSTESPFGLSHHFSPIRRTPVRAQWTAPIQSQESPWIYNDDMVAENGLTQREVEANEPLLQYQTQEPEDYVCCWDFQETRGYHDLKPDPKSRSALTSPLQRVPSTTFPSPEENCGTLRDDGNEDDWDFLHNASSGISSYDLTEDPDVASGEHKNFQQTYTQVENDSLNLNSNLYPKACFSASSCHGHHLEPSYSSERRSQAKADLQNRPILRRHAKALRHQLRRLRQAWDELRSEKATLRHERAALHHEKTRLQSGRRRFPNHNRQQPTDFSSNSSDSSGSNGPASYNGDSERSTTRTLSPPSSPSRHRHPPPSVPSPSPLQAYNTAWSTLLSSPSSSTPPSLPYPTPTLTPSPLLFPPSHPLTPPSWRTFPHLHTHPIVVYNTVRFFAAAFGLVVIPASSLTSTGKDTDSSRHPFEVVNADESAVGPLRKQMDREVGRWHEDRLRARGVIISSGEEVDGEGERERRHGAVCERDIVKGVWEGVRALRAWARESS